MEAVIVRLSLAEHVADDQLERLIDLLEQLGALLYHLREDDGQVQQLIKAVLSESLRLVAQSSQQHDKGNE